MRNEVDWKETKFTRKDGLLNASPDPGEVGIALRLMATLIAREYQQAISAHATGRLLDLGCGKVPLYGTYKERVSSITCVDWANSEHRNIHIDKEANLTQPPDFPDCSFETVILSDVLEHIPVPLDLCREIARILSPGGKLLMNVLFYYWLHEAPFDFYRYTEHALRRFMQSLMMRFAKAGPPIAATIQRASIWFCGTGVGGRASRFTAGQFPFATSWLPRDRPIL